MFWLLILFLPVLSSCDTTPVSISQNCDVRLIDVAPESARPGDVIAAQGGPMTQVWDSAVYVDGTRAELVDIQRVGCETCDTCKAENSCEACDDCDACDDICATECSESIQFVTPELESGTVQISMYNGHGQSNSIPLYLVSDTDTGIDSGTSSPLDTSVPVDTGLTESTDPVDDPPTDTGD